MTHEKILEDWRRDVKACVDGNDPMSDDDYCGRCGMHFKARPNSLGHPIETTICAEPKCGRWFAHGSTAHRPTEFSAQPVTVYKIDRHMPDIGP